MHACCIWHQAAPMMYKNIVYAPFALVPVHQALNHQCTGPERCPQQSVAQPFCLTDAASRRSTLPSSRGSSGHTYKHVHPYICQSSEVSVTSLLL